MKKHYMKDNLKPNIFDTGGDKLKNASLVNSPKFRKFQLLFKGISLAPIKSIVINPKYYVSEYEGEVAFSLTTTTGKVYCSFFTINEVLDTNRSMGIEEVSILMKGRLVHGNLILLTATNR